MKSNSCAKTSLKHIHTYEVKLKNRLKGNILQISQIVHMIVHLAVHCTRNLLVKSEGGWISRALDVSLARSPTDNMQNAGIRPYVNFGVKQIRVKVIRCRDITSGQWEVKCP